MPYPKRLIEVDLPIKRISAHARREKSIRHGHISTLHIWWARRPLAACRAVICASLWPDPVDELCPEMFRERATEIITAFAKKAGSTSFTGKLSEESSSRWIAMSKGTVELDAANPKHWNVLRYALLDFIADFANWDNSTHEDYLETSRALTQGAHEALGGEPGTRPLVVDPFAGGGSIPLEALRVGADAFASDLNPVAVLLNKVVLEYIPKYGQRLADELRKWGQWIKEEAEKELAEFYPDDSDNGNLITYLWSKTILSEAPGQGEFPVEIPLFRSMWLAKRKDGNVAFRWQRSKDGLVETELVELKYSDGSTHKVLRPVLEIFEPKSASEVSQGTSKGGAATCPVTGYTNSVERVREQLKKRGGGSSDARLLCVVKTHPNRSGRIYRKPNLKDIETAHLAEERLQELSENDLNGIWVKPEGKLNHLRGFFNVVLYGMDSWGDLFSPRQALSLLTISNLINKAGELVGSESGDEFKTALQTTLSMALGRLADYSSNSCMWSSSGEFIAHTFGRQALPMVWDFAEINPLADFGWSGACEWVGKVIDATAAAHLEPGNATAVSATRQDHMPDDAVDATITDPPYYAAIPYADLSDFFYSWLKKSLTEIHPDLFQSALTPKEDECVSLSHRAAMYRYKDGVWFEKMMAQACLESRRVTSPAGISVYVFANKETAGWEAMLSALIDSGWVVTASWPIDTERGGRLRARNSAALASSVHLVCRPRENPDGSLRSEIGDWRDVLQELPQRIHDWMPRLAQEGVVGADAIFACLGPALEIFSRYSSVEKASGEEVTLREYLEYVWGAVSKEALGMIFTDADTTDFEEDARLTAMWLWTLSAGDTTSTSPDDTDDTGKPAKSTGYTLEYDAARKIAQGLGAHLDKLTTLVEIKGDKARLLPVGERAQALFGKEDLNAPTTRRKKKSQDKQLDLFAILGNPEDPDSSSFGDPGVPQVGKTVLDRLHQSMILFAAGRSEALKRFLVEEGIGADQRYWKLAQAFSALYPTGTDEKRWVDGVLSRKKGLGF